VIFVVITLFLPFFYNSGVASIYDYQERRFGPRAMAVISSIWLVSQTMTSAAILYATSLVLEFITGIDVVHAIVIVTVIPLIYTVLGGITAVIWTDVAQAAILLIGAIIILSIYNSWRPSQTRKQLPEYKKYKRGMSTRLSGPSWSVTPTQREKLTYYPEIVLASVRRQFIFVHSLTRTRSSPCHEVFSSVLADLALCLWIRPSEKRQNGRWRSGWW
jgi:Na+(H+)/acetate symporter ActP